MDIHAQFMKQVFFTALSRMGITSPNPPVGALVVKNGIVIADGGTQVCGGAHAERCALEKAGASAEGADMYVTLEPCCHFGKTPPCTNAIIASKIARVFIPIIDPNPKVSGMGVKALRDAGIEVTILDEYSAYARQILEPFFTRIYKKRPMVLYKTAHTADGCTATDCGDSKWISSELSRYVVHRLRALTDAIMIGKNTCAEDNPSLTCRMDDFPEQTRNKFTENIIFSGEDNILLKYLLSPDYDHCGRDPLRIIAGLPDLHGINMNFTADDNYMVFEKEENLEAIKNNPGLKNIIEQGTLLIIPRGADREEFMLASLFEKGVNYILLEGGGTLAGSFFRKKLIDQFMSFTAPKIIGGGREILSSGNTVSMADAMTLSDISCAFLGGDLLYHGYLRG
jgi:diaminohydroxyphosphoribosylaminopyrimidine deaminase / 5-amino-6-(5-phosphoribosylamino)uracil reductase